MATPEIFSRIEINGKAYRLQHVQARDDGGQVWMVSRVDGICGGTMYRVVVGADGSFGPVKFAY